ncbi:MAG: putative zinc-binding protein [Methanobrevibacter sp.]|nr:putative zinc-binding protein [Methanobrevibacter sp.]
MEEKIALAACSGMSPNGLVARVAVHDLAIDDHEILSICMGSTSADDGSFKSMANKYPVLAINGCEGNCVAKILSQKGIDVVGELNVGDILAETDFKANDAARLDEEGEKCVRIVKEIIEDKINSL